MSSKKYVIGEHWSPELKKCYLGLLIWVVYFGDSQIDEQELCEIQVLMAQLKCDADVRQTVRSYLEAPQNLDAEAQITRMLELIPSEMEPESLKYSLMKDAIRMCRTTSEDSVIEQPAIQQLTELFQLSQEQVVFLEEGCMQDEKILSGELSDSQIKKLVKGLAAKGTAVGVPIAAVYVSGSVIGLSAAGITSGLAALGGGLSALLGLSAMVTGIGTAVIAGLVVHKGVKWILSGSKRKRESIRELMLQDILRIHQVAIANLAEDISFYGERIAALGKDTDRNRNAIDKLYQDMTLMSAALTRLRGRASGFERDMQDQ